MYCERCGRKLKDDALFCENCGTKVQLASADETVKLPERQIEEKPDTSGVDVSAYPTAVQSPMGAPSASQTTPMPAAPEQKQDFVAPQVQPEKKKLKKPLIIAIVASVVVLIAIIALVVALVVSGGESDESEPTRGYTSLKEQQLTESLKDSENTSSTSNDLSSAAGDVIDSPRGYVLSDSDTRYYSEGELSALTDYELYLARNEIYARHGREFNNQDLQDYFSNKDWYTPRYSPESFDSIVTLNAYEKKNAETILAIEKRRGSSYLS